MGRLERQTKRFIVRIFFELLRWILVSPFKLLRSLFSGRKTARHINSKGYVVLSDFNELEHRRVAVFLLGRDLKSNEVVHHINGNKTDNKVRNLCLMDAEKHEHFHAWLRWKKEKSGRYPTIKNQKRLLEEEYGGILLEKIKPSYMARTEQYEMRADYSLNPRLQKRLLEDLKAVREMLAIENNVPLYMIFNNKTLVEMSEKMPSSESEMLQIRGVGPIKMSLYGSYFLHEIRVFKKTKGERSA